MKATHRAILQPLVSNSEHDHRIHNIRMRMQLRQHVEADIRELISELQDLRRKRRWSAQYLQTLQRFGKKWLARRTGYKTVLKPRALLATIKVPGFSNRTKEAKMETFSDDPIPTRAARNTTSKVSHAIARDVEPVWSPISSHTNDIRLDGMRRSFASFSERSRACASRSTLTMFAFGKLSSKQMELSGSGPDPRKATLRVLVWGKGRKADRRLDSSRDKSM